MCPAVCPCLWLFPSLLVGNSPGHREKGGRVVSMTELSPLTSKLLRAPDQREEGSAEHVMLLQPIRHAAPAYESVQGSRPSQSSRSDNGVLEMRVCPQSSFPSTQLSLSFIGGQFPALCTEDSNRGLVPVNMQVDLYDQPGWFQPLNGYHVCT